MTLPAHSTATVSAATIQQNPAAASQFGMNVGASAAAAAQAAMNRTPPSLIMAYRQPGLVQQQPPQVASVQHPQANSPAAAVSNAGNSANVAAAAAAMAAASMHSIPLFPSHFNPFATCNAPILLPGGQMVVRTPQGQLIGFQVRTGVCFAWI